jgi:hypothetical protein
VEVRTANNKKLEECEIMIWPRWTCFLQLPSTVTITIDHPIGSTSLMRMDYDDDDDDKLVWPTCAVSALFWGATRIHINRVLGRTSG